MNTLMHNKSKVYVVFNAVFFIATIVVNSLANIIPFNGQGTGEISDSLPNLFVPANVTFAIWGGIYALLAGFVIFSIVSIFKADDRESANFSETPTKKPTFQSFHSIINQIGPWFIITSVVNSLWIIAWHWNLILLTLLLMLILLASLIWIYILLTKVAKPSISCRLFVLSPFSVYLAWITVATIANATALLVSLKWNGFGLAEEFWASLMVIIALIFAIYFLIFRRDIAYSLVLAWAIFGIWLKRSAAVSTIPDASVEIVATIATLIILLLVAILCLQHFVRKLIKRGPKSH